MPSAPKKTKAPRSSPKKAARRDPWTQPITFPAALPINARREEIANSIQQNQVVIIAGETGSGKTTQIPKICLALGYGEKGLIGHTQPRRIAARTVADRIASELKTPLGNGVGYQVRFKDNSSADTRIKLMTDGVLLAEFQHDRLLRKYEVIIIDEAHERSLNIDFLLGLLKRLCTKRPELKVIITSATIDLVKFSKHFSIKGKDAPIIEVSGRTFPVETIYHEPTSSTIQLADQITDTVKQIIRDEAKGLYKTSGDILVFCAGEREIKDAAQALRRQQLPIEVLPLYSRLSVAEQNKIFRPAQQRKVVLATNVAETSITVPGIAYVIDPGTARISRYSFRSKVQRLPIEAISQASANQRKGRCGRVQNGICFRLYSQSDFDQRAEFTPAEILRSNLASVILKMLRLGIKDINQFDFLDMPDSRLLNDGFKLLEELEAVTPQKKLSAIGRQMSDLSLDPKFARILIEANTLGCIRDCLILLSALSIQDPRERPSDKQQAADQAHRLLLHPQSDFYAYLHLWQAINDAKEELSNSKFKQHCIDHYWSIARIFEWRELFRQLLGQCKSLGWKFEEWQPIKLDELKPKDKAKPSNNKEVFSTRYELLHKSLLSGLLSNIATKELDHEYLATRSRRIHIFPGSSQAKPKPKWIIAASYLETSRLFAHTVAQIKPDWVTESAKHLCRYSYSAPHYNVKAGTIMAYQKTLLQGLTLRDKEKVSYAKLNAKESRQIFIAQALVEGKYQPQTQSKKLAGFVAHNSALIRDIEKIETKTRRRNLLVNDQIIHEFYEQKLPAEIVSRHALESWLAKGNEQLLKLDRSTVLKADVDAEQSAQFPETLTICGKDLRVQYKFDPGKLSDGVTLIVPISVLAPLPLHIGDWLVAGLLREKCVALIKTLAKPIRRNFAPASDAINRVYNNLEPSELALTQVLAEQLFRTRGVKVAGDDFDLSKLDDFYLMNYRIIDTDGSLIEESRDLAALKLNYAHAVQQSVHAHNAPERKKLEQHNLQNWSFGELQNSIEYQHQGMTVRAYPMLKCRDDGSVSLLVHDQIKVANYHSHHAKIQLAQTALSNTTQKQSLKYLRKELMAVKQSAKSSNLGSLATQLKSAPLVGHDRIQWIDKLINAGINQACFGGDTLSITTRAAFEQALANGGKHWVSSSMELEASLVSALKLRDSVLKKANELRVDTIAIDMAVEDIKAQAYRLFEPSFLSYTPLSQLKQIPRYLRAIESRLEKLKFSSKTLDQELALEVMQKNFNHKVHELSLPDLDVDYVYLGNPKLLTFAKMLEEWRVSLYAQHLKTQMPVSEKRLKSFWNTEIKSISN